MKVYVAVTVHFTMDGKVLPMSFIWEDGQVYQIEKVKNVCQLDDRDFGGFRTMYICQVKGRVTHLYYESGPGGRWFLERKAA